ncbi:MAG: hypothetical protein ACJ75T_01810 [Solirubrobacterales bacterium]
MRKRAGALAVLGMTLIGIPVAHSAVIQDGDLRITVQSQIKPFRLPRTGTAPIAVFVTGHIGTPSKTIPPQLQTMDIEVNRHGLLRSTGLPTCRRGQIETASTARSLRECGEALVGSGRFWANVVFPDQKPFPTRGRLLIFNGREGGRPAIFAHIYTRSPFATSFLVVFKISHIHRGPYGTELSASLPATLGNWGFVDRIKLTLRRKYRWHGRQLSYFNAGCPALPGTQATAFPLARVSFGFAERKPIALTVDKACRVAG